MYAIEALALFDHYHFRKAMQKANQGRSVDAVVSGQVSGGRSEGQAVVAALLRQDPHRHARPLPVRASAVAGRPRGTKNVDWASIDAEAGKKKPAVAKKAKTGKSKTAKASGAEASTTKAKKKKSKTAKTKSAKKSKKAAGQTKSKAKKKTTKKVKRPPRPRRQPRRQPEDNQKNPEDQKEEGSEKKTSKRG